MRIFLNSAETGDIHTALQSGYVYGVTVNPTLLRQAGVFTRQVPALVRQMIEWGAQQIHLQTYGEEVGQIVREGQMLAAIDPERVVVRVPATDTGYAAGAQLTAQGIRLDMVAVYTLRQALLAHSIRANFITVYLGRMRESGFDALEQIGRIQRLYRAQNSAVQIIAGSIREALLVETTGLQGVYGTTMPLSVLSQLNDSPATTNAASTFRVDAEAILDDMTGIGGH